MTTRTTTPQMALAEVRKEIDAIDDALHDLLMKRTELVVEVAEAKARAASAAGQGGFVAFRPAREAEVLRRLAGRHRGSLPLRTVFRVWREIMAAMTRIQGPFRVDVFGGNRESALRFWDLARNSYGSTTPMSLHDTARDVISRIGHDRSAIGVLPMPGADMAGDWWTMLGAGRGTGSGADKEPSSRIVARLPFVEMDRNDDSAVALVVAQAGFDPTGRDTSLVAIYSTESLSDDRVVSLFEAAGFEGRRITGAKLADTTAPHAYLIAIPVHVAADDERLAALESKPVAEVRLLGGYANPLRLARDGE